MTAEVAQNQSRATRWPSEAFLGVRKRLKSNRDPIAIAVLWRCGSFFEFLGLPFENWKSMFLSTFRKSDRGSRSVFRTRGNNRVAPIRKWKSAFRSLFRKTDRDLSIRFSKKGPESRFRFSNGSNPIVAPRAKNKP